MLNSFFDTLVKLSYMEESLLIEDNSQMALEDFLRKDQRNANGDH